VVFLVTVVLAALSAWFILSVTTGSATYLSFMIMGWFAGGVIVGTYSYFKGRGQN